MSQKENSANNNSGPVGLILAAGLSSRMGSFKPLLPIGDMTAIERIIDTLRKAGVQNIVGVTGFQRERLSPILEAQNVAEAFNPDFEQGMFTSIKAGIAKAMAGTDERIGKPDGFFLMLADSPLAPPEVLKMILEKHREHPDAFILPCFRGKNGHPLFIPVQYAEEILTYKGEGGLKAVRNRHEDRLIRLEAGTEAVVLDMDTPEGYEEILEYHEMCGGVIKIGQDYESQLRGRRLFLIRHGEIRQHREKIFLGQADVPLSEKGIEQAVQAAEELKQYGVNANRIYASDLSRASETAEIIGDRLDRSRRVQAASERPAAAISVILEPRLREMSLGEWDGCYISEIMERYPEEYRKRGETILTYKFGNDSENFFDLQYRVMKGFRSILKQEREAGDGAKDILIVAHLGVLNAILSSLNRTEPGEEMNRSMREEMNRSMPNGGVIVMDYTNANKEI